MTIDEHIAETRRLIEAHELKLFSPELYENVSFLLEYLSRLVESSEEESDVAGLA